MNDQEHFAAHCHRPTPSKTPTLDQMGSDLTAQARQGKVAPVSDQDKDLLRVIQVLCRHSNPRTGFRKNNIVLISEPELGRRKMAIVSGLAQLMVAPRMPAVALGAEALERSWLESCQEQLLIAPRMLVVEPVGETLEPSWLLCQEQLQGKRLVTLDVGLLATSATSAREVGERFKTILEEIRSSQDCILFIDELHTLLGAEAAWGRVNFANLLVPKLAREEMQCIGATTLDEYRQYIEKDAALQRRFQEVIIHESVSGA
jgi:ATP-dependent Clp protease ATP-binding subunit ClpC